MLHPALLSLPRSMRYRLAFKYTPGDSLVNAGATFSRGSTATQDDSTLTVQTALSNVARDGNYIGSVRTLLLESLRTNVLLWSEDFTNVAWQTLGGVTTGATADTVAPDGASTANKCTTTAATGVFGKFQSFTYTAAAYTLSIFAKKGTYNFLTLDFNNAGNSGAVFNLNTGVVGFTDAGVTATITALGNGWYYCTATSTRAAVASFPEWYLSGSGTANTRSWTAAGTEALYVWGADLEIGAFATSYIKTTTGALSRSVDSLSFPGVTTGTATLFQRYYDLATNAFVDAVSAYTSGTTITPTLNRSYQVIAVLPGTYTAPQAAAVLGVP